MKYNEDVKLRDSILHWNERLDKAYKEHCKDYEKNYEIRYFDQLDADTLQQLIDLKFADPKEKQEDAPTIANFLKWLRDNPDYKAHGYVVSINRDDYRVSIEGVDGCAKTPEALNRFIKMFRKANEFHVDADYQRAWYD